jgi:hypothetical protein
LCDPWSWFAACSWRCRRAGAACSPVTRRRTRLPFPHRLRLMRRPFPSMRAVHVPHASTGRGRQATPPTSLRQPTSLRLPAHSSAPASTDTPQCLSRRRVSSWIRGLLSSSHHWAPRLPVPGQGRRLAGRTFPRQVSRSTSSTASGCVEQPGVSLAPARTLAYTRQDASAGTGPAPQIGEAVMRNCMAFRSGAGPPAGRTRNPNCSTNPQDHKTKEIFHA